MQNKQCSESFVMFLYTYPPTTLSDQYSYSLYAQMIKQTLIQTRQAYHMLCVLV